VHAWLFGVLASVGERDVSNMARVTYNPFRTETFERTDSGEPIAAAGEVYCAGAYAYVGRP
jgi:hypothetical protein